MLPPRASVSAALVARGELRTHRQELTIRHTLLSNLGINTSQLQREIAQLPAEAAAASRPRRRRKANAKLTPLGDLGPAYAIGDADVGAWGRNWHEMVILSGIEVQRQKTVKSFQKQFEKRILSNWETEKSRVLQDELGVTDDELAKMTTGSSRGMRESVLGKSRLGSGDVRRFPLATSTLGGKSSLVECEGGLVMHNKAIKYEKVVAALNQHRLRREPFELCLAFEAATKGDSKYPLLPDAFNILAHMMQEPSLHIATGYGSSSNAIPVTQRQYAKAYLSPTGSNAKMLLNGRLVSGSRAYLERDFERYMNDTIQNNPKEAALGGIPGITNKVRAFTDVTLRSKEAQDTYRPETVNGIKLWAQVYYLLRAGHPADALTLVEQNQANITKDDWSFPGAFKAFFSSPERRLPKTLRDQLYSDFNAHVRNNPQVDQFKYALYKLIGRFELSKKNVKVAGTTEDWVWFQLSLTRENKDGDPPQEQYDLADLGRHVLKVGSDAFDSNGQRPFKWFNLLLVTAQFERAIGYLYSKPALKTDAVHFAAALQYYGTLRVPDTPTTDILIEDNGPALNYARLTQLYIAPFYRVEPQAALQYAYLVSLASDAPAPIGTQQRQLALDLVRDIVIGSRQYARLLGSVRADGTKETGPIERDLALLNLSDEDDYLREVVLAAADQAANDASLAESVELYHLAGAYDKVVEVVTRALGHSLSGSSPHFDRPAPVSLSGAFGGATDLDQLASAVHDVYARDFAKRSRISQRNWDTLEVLLKLRSGLAQYAAKRPDLALETFRSTGLLPLDNDTAGVARYAQRFRELLDAPVVSNLDTVIVTTMRCLHDLTAALKESPYGDHGRMQTLASYKHMAQCLIQFASTLRLRLGPDVYKQLSAMSAFF